MARKPNGKPAEDRAGDVADLESLLGTPPSGEGTAGDGAIMPGSTKELAAQLKALAESLVTIHPISPGQLVQWKKGMKNRRTPAYGDPVIVIQLLDQPVYDRDQKNGAGSPYFREPLTLVAGRLNNEGDMACYHYDQRRMEPYLG